MHAGLGTMGGEGVDPARRGLLEVRVEVGDNAAGSRVAGLQRAFSRDHALHAVAGIGKAFLPKAAQVSDLPIHKEYSIHLPYIFSFQQFY